MEALFAESNRNIEEVSQLFAQLEKYIGHSDELIIEETIRKKLEIINVSFNKLENYVQKEQPSKRQATRLRLNQLKYDATHLGSSLKNFQNKRYRRERENSDREDLLNRRFTPNESTSINIDYSVNHHNSLQNANRGVDEMLNQGYHVLTSLQDQKSMLKKTRTRLLDFANTLGLSNTVMKLIERRAHQDKFILFGGMFLTLVIIFLIYIYFL